MTRLQILLHSTNKVLHYCRQYCIKQINQSKIYLPSYCQNDKKDSRELNLQPQGSLFLTWFKRSLQNQTHNLKSLFLRRGLKGLTRIKPTTSMVSFSYMVKHTAYLIIPCKHPASYQLLCNQDESPLLRAQMPLLASPHGNQLFPHQYIQQQNIRSTCPKACFTSDPNNFTPKSNNFTPD